MPAPDDCYRVAPDEGGWRLDKLVARVPSVGSRRRARHAIETGKVRIDGEPADPRGGAVPVPAGATVSVAWRAAGTHWNRARAGKILEDAGLRIIHADEDVVAIDKPAGMLTDTATRRQARERDSVRKRVHAWLTSQADAAYVVHRIDRDTSGVVLLARNEHAAQDLRTQFREREPLRRYRALVWSIPAAGHWVDWMAWDRRHRRQLPRPEGSAGASRASSQARVVESFGTGASELEVTLESGRRNQIRLQAWLRGAPLVGEVQYVDRESLPRWRIEAPRQMLHACALEVRHPRTGGRLRIEAPPPEDYQTARERLRARASRDAGT